MQKLASLMGLDYGRRSLKVVVKENRKKGVYLDGIMVVVSNCIRGGDPPAEFLHLFLSIVLMAYLTLLPPFFPSCLQACAGWER